VNPKLLRFFVAVANGGSITQASRALSRAQSAVTGAIRELEMSVGADLFERRPRGMIPTPAGRLLLARAERALLEMETCKAAFAAALADDRWVRNAPIFSLSASMMRLLAYVTLADQHSMAAVAASLGMSQPAVSQALHTIETGLGVKLFQRTPTSMLPTPLGALLALHIKRALAELRIAEEEILSLEGGVQGSVVVGSLSLGRNRLLPLACTRLLASYPELSIRTEEGSFEHLAARLREGQIDFMLGALRRPEHTVGLARTSIARDVMGIVVRASHPLANERNLTLADLSGMRWVLPRRGTPTRELLENTLRLRGLEPPRIAVETADLAVTLGVLLSSNMVTAASPHVFRREIDAGVVVVLPLALPETVREVGILQRARGVPSPAARRLIEIIREIGALWPEESVAAR
jgi:LysR family transcriptional regulator of gallate degradation